MITKKALLSTSMVRLDTYHHSKSGEIVATEPSPLLLQLLEKGYEVHVVTGRPGLTGKLDGCWVGLVKTVQFIPLGRVFVSHQHAEMLQQQAIAEAQDVLRDLQVPFDHEQPWATWGDHRHYAAAAGWFVGWSTQYIEHGLKDGPHRKIQPIQEEPDIQF